VKGFKKIHKALVIAGVVVIGMMVCMPQELMAVATEEQMANWPFPMYQGEELEKMRELKCSVSLRTGEQKSCGLR
jgi:hypothetical protein